MNNYQKKHSDCLVKYVIATLMPKKMVAQKLRKLTGKIVIHIVKKLLGMALLATALLLPLVNIFTATQVEASEQTEQVALMPLEEVSDLIMSPGC